MSQLDFYDQVERGIIASMTAWLCDGRALNVLDAGCGEGMPALTFAEQGCRVIGVDVDAASLDAAERLVAASPYVDRVTLHRASLLQLPFDDAQFDLVWTSYVLHHIADKLAAVRELRRVLKSGGRLAIREGGLPLQMLPFDIGLGEPGLQDRLRIADNRWFTAMTRATLPDETPYPFGWSKLLSDASFTDITAKTFTLDLLSPFDAAPRAFVEYHLRRTLERDAGEYGPLLSDADREALRQLLDPDEPHYVLKRDDLHVRYGLSVYVGRKNL